MLYLFAGDDSKKKYTVLEKFLGSFSGTAENLTITRNNFLPEEIENLCSGTSLFGQIYLVVLENILDEAKPAEFILSRLGLLAQSGNHFVFLESRPGKTVLDIFKKARAELNIFELPKEKKEKYNNFLLANDFGQKDKFSLWFHYREAVDLGVGLEELVGVLFWKAKDMILKRNFSKFSKEELQNLSGQIAYLLPEARKDGRDAEVAMEEFLLEAF